MRCVKYENSPENLDILIDRFVSAKLSADQLSSFEDHFFQCESCYQQLRIRERLRFVVRGPADEVSGSEVSGGAQHSLPLLSPQLDTSPSPQRIRSAGLYYRAAAAIIVLAVSVYFFMFHGGKAYDGPEYQHLAYYEEMLNETQRSGANMGIISATPAVGEEFEMNSRIIFRWQANFDGPVNLSIVDNSGRTLLEDDVPSTSYRLQKQLSAGLYYWKLLANGELLYIGKFYITK